MTQQKELAEVKTKYNLWSQIRNHISINHYKLHKMSTFLCVWFTSCLLQCMVIRILILVVTEDTLDSQVHGILTWRAWCNDKVQGDPLRLPSLQYCSFCSWALRVRHDIVMARQDWREAWVVHIHWSSIIPQHRLDPDGTRRHDAVFEIAHTGFPSFHSLWFQHRRVQQLATPFLVARSIGEWRLLWEHNVSVQYDGAHSSSLIEMNPMDSWIVDSCFSSLTGSSIGS